MATHVGADPAGSAESLGPQIMHLPVLERQAERTAFAAVRTRERARKDLHEVAARCGVGGSEDAELMTGGVDVAEIDGDEHGAFGRWFVEHSITRSTCAAGEMAR